MTMAKVAITVDRDLLRDIDRWVLQGHYASRSQAVQAALREKVQRWQHVRLAAEVKKLNPREEQALADEAFSGEGWPAY